MTKFPDIQEIADKSGCCDCAASTKVGVIATLEWVDSLGREVPLGRLLSEVVNAINELREQQ